MRAKPARRFQLTGSSTHSAVMVRSRRSVLLKLLVRRNVRRADNARVEVDVPHDGPMVLRNLADTRKWLQASCSSLGRYERKERPA